MSQIRRRVLDGTKIQQWFLPDGYTQLEYIEDITKGIVTDIEALGSQWEFDVMSTNSATQVLLAASDVGYGRHVGIRSTNTYYLDGSNAITIAADTRVTVIADFGVTEAGKTTLSIGGDTVAIDTGNISNEAKLLAYNTTSYVYKGRVYGVKCLAGGSFNGVPARRDSDNKEGIYEFASETFYELK